MTSQNRDPELALRLARAVVAALQASEQSKTVGPDRGVFLLPAYAPRTSEEMTEELASLPKPVACVGFASPHGLILGYWPVPRDVNDGLVDRYRAMMRRGLAALRREADASCTGIALVVRTGIAALTWEEYEAVQEDYMFPFGGWAIDRCSRKLARAGFARIVRFKQGEPTVSEVRM